MRTLLIVPALLALVVSPLDAQPPRAVHGTYAVWICPQGCAVGDTASAAVSGFLVLNDSPFALDSLSAEVRLRSWSFLRGESPTACFHLAKRSKVISSFAGIVPRAATTWTQRGDTVKFLLYASPDAFYSVAAVADGARLTGPGWESGYIGTAFEEPGGDVHGVRIGPADVRRCQDTAK